MVIVTDGLSESFQDVVDRAFEFYNIEVGTPGMCAGKNQSRGLEREWGGGLILSTDEISCRAPFS